MKKVKTIIVRIDEPTHAAILKQGKKTSELIRELLAKHFDKVRKKRLGDGPQ